MLACGALAFETTRWSLVLAAGSDDTLAARAALAALCESYWQPLYVYVRSRGRSPDDARDITQGFLASLVERQDFRRLSQDRGRFRSFLLAALQHFIANDTGRRRAQKRGGDRHFVPLDFDLAEGEFLHEPVDRITPESLYERKWARTVIHRVLTDLRQDWAKAGEHAYFDALKSCLLGQTPPGGYAAIARSLGSSEGAIKVAVHRLRRSFQTSLRRHIAETVSDPSEIDDEIRYLIRALDP